MHRHKKNNPYKNYILLIPSSSKSSRNTHNSFPDPRLHIQKSSYSNITPISTYSIPRIQHQYQPSTTVSNFVEPILVVGNQKSSKHHQSFVSYLPSIYKPSNLNRQSSINDERLATASVMRERLLKDIQQNISEIDQELSLLKRRPSISHYVSPHLSPIVDVRQTSSHNKILLPNDESQTWPNKPKRIYQVIPHITSETKITSQQSTPTLPEKITSNSVIGQYHYAPEIQQIQIHENDPENSDLKSTFNEISRFNFHETFSLNQVHGQQFDLPKNRALILVPQYVDNYDIRTNESTEDLHQNNPIDTNFARSSSVKSLHDLTSSSKLNIKDFQSLIQTAPESKQLQISSENVLNSHESFNKTEPKLNNTILSKPIKHSHLSIKTQEIPSSSSLPMRTSQNHTDFNMNYFFGDVGNECEGEEDLISIDPYRFALPIESEIISDDNRSHTFTKQLQALQQRQTSEYNTQYVKETEKKKIDATTKHIVTPMSTTTTSSSKKILPISIYDDTTTQSTRNNNNNNEDQR
ncbi:unnamed protein product [Rotaria sordida]|uniref:Uncharacterized protein n=1 Tax=Rotaria sordida TaxID=392033 RepID=A0A814JY81_9BILA|nr:unnamed protein product [Rotaria sordida]